MKTQFFLLLTTLLYAFVVGASGMLHLLLTDSTPEYMVFSVLYERRTSKPILLLLSILVLSPGFALLLVFLHPDTVPVGMIFLSALFAVWTIYTLRLLFLRFKNAATPGIYSETISKLHTQLYLSLVASGVCLAYMVFKTMTA